MNKSTITAALAVSLLFTGSLSAEELAKLLSASGSVQVTLAGGAATDAVIDQDLPNGAKIKTGADGSASIKLDDGTVITMSANSEMQISPYSRKSSKKNSILLFLGSIWSKVTKSFDGKISYVVSTPNAVAGVRGTEFGVTVADDGAARVQVKEGVVGVGEEEAELNKDLKANQQIVGDEKGIGKMNDYNGNQNDDWQANRTKNLQKNGKKLGNAVMTKIKGRKAKIARLNKELAKALETKKEYEKAIKLGNKEAELQLKMLLITINDLYDHKAALADQANSQVILYEHYLELAKDPRFNMVDAKTLQANAASLYEIKKDLDKTVREGMDISMGAMENMMNEYSNGARNTLREKDGSAAEELFKTTPGFEM